MDDERIVDAKNRVFSDSLGIGKDKPNKLVTDNLHIYRKTGFNQIADIVNTGYVRPKDKVRGGHHREVFWSQGGEKLFYFDKTPILEIEASKLYDGMMGAVNLYDLSAIYIFDEMRNCYVNRLEIIKMLYEERHNNLGETINNESVNFTEEEEREKGR